MDTAVARLMKVMPFLFGIGFIAPCIAQIVPGAARGLGLAMSPVAFGLLVGGSWGLVTTYRGRWL